MQPIISRRLSLPQMQANFAYVCDFSLHCAVMPTALVVVDVLYYNHVHLAAFYRKLGERRGIPFFAVEGNDVVIFKCE